MPKRIRILALIVLTFALMGCHPETELEECSVLPSLHITMISQELDSILVERDNKVSAYAFSADASYPEKAFEVRL